MAVDLQEKYDAILDGITSGATQITYSGKSISFRSIDEMISTARLIQRLMGNKAGRFKTARLRYVNPNIGGFFLDENRKTRSFR